MKIIPVLKKTILVFAIVVVGVIFAQPKPIFVEATSSLKYTGEEGDDLLNNFAYIDWFLNYQLDKHEANLPSPKEHFGKFYAVGIEDIHADNLGEYSQLVLEWSERIARYNALANLINDTTDAFSQIVDAWNTIANTWNSEQKRDLEAMLAFNDAVCAFYEINKKWEGALYSIDTKIENCQ